MDRNELLSLSRFILSLTYIERNHSYYMNLNYELRFILRKLRKLYYTETIKLSVYCYYFNKIIMVLGDYELFKYPIMEYTDEILFLVAKDLIYGYKDGNKNGKN